MGRRTDALADDAAPERVEGVSGDPRRLVEAEVGQGLHAPRAPRDAGVPPLRVFGAPPPRPGRPPLIAAGPGPVAVLLVAVVSVILQGRPPLGRLLDVDGVVEVLGETSPEVAPGDEGHAQGLGRRHGDVGHRDGVTPPDEAQGRVPLLVEVGQVQQTPETQG